jgi:hypothetical protein
MNLLLFAISRGIYFSVITNVVFLQRNVWFFFPCVTFPGIYVQVMLLDARVVKARELVALDV